MCAWSAEIIEHVRVAADARFADQLRQRDAAADFPHSPWDVATLPEERGLEAWIGWLGLWDRRAFVAAAAAAARHAYPIVVERAGEQAMQCGVHEDAPSADGASEGMKIRLVEQWLLAPSAEATAAVAAAIDPSRQLEIWDDDLVPSDDQMWWWFVAVGELTARAVVHEEAGVIGRSGDPHTWPAAACAARATVCALRSIRSPDGNVESDLAALGRAIATAFGL